MDARGTSSNSGVELPRDAIEAFCRRWQITELALFGSVLRDDFGRDSDIDFLATFAPETRWSLVDRVRMQRELGELVGRKVDLVSRRAIEQSENWIRKREILGTARPYYVS